MKKRNQFSRVGIAYAVYNILIFALLIGLNAAMSFVPATPFYTYAYYISAMGFQYIIGTLAIRAMLFMPDENIIPQKGIDAGEFIKYCLLTLFVMLAGSALGTVTNWLLAEVFCLLPPPTVTEMLQSYPPMFLIVEAVACAPLAEEYIFRKLIIDRLYERGKPSAILISAILFGLAHGNFEQFFYAFGIGLVFGCIYAETGRLRYSVLLHFIINLISVMQILLPDPMAAALSIKWAVVVFMGAVGGLVILIAERKRVRCKGVYAKEMLLNFGIISAFVVSVMLFVLNYI